MGKLPNPSRPSPRWRAILLASALTPLALSMQGCEHLPLVGKTVLVQRTAPPPDLTTCAAEPTMPAVFVSEVDRYSWAQSAILAGRECRTILGKLAEWAVTKL